MIKIYVKATPISQWQYIGKANDWTEANKIIARANANGYYAKGIE